MEKLTTYKKLSTLFYQHEHHPRHAAAVSFYLDQAQVHGSPILEPMCGSGRFLLPLIERGFICDGFDASEEMLSVIKEKVANSSCRFFHMYFQSFIPDKKYNLVFIPYGSFGLMLKKEEALAALKTLADCVEAAGRIFIEIETVSSVPAGCGTLQIGQHKLSQDGQIIRLKTIPSYTASTQLFKAECRYELIENGIVTQIESETFEQYLYLQDEFDLLVQEANLKIVGKYADHDKNTAHKNSPFIIYELAKD